MPSDVTDDLRALMTACWCTDPRQRPNCEEVLSKLNQMSFPNNHWQALFGNSPLIDTPIGNFWIGHFPFGHFTFRYFPFRHFPFGHFAFGNFSLGHFSLGLFPSDSFPLDIFPLNIFIFDIFSSDICLMVIFPFGYFPFESFEFHSNHLSQSSGHLLYRWKSRWWRRWGFGTQTYLNHYQKLLSTCTSISTSTDSTCSTYTSTPTWLNHAQTNGNFIQKRTL